MIKKILLLIITVCAANIACHSQKKNESTPHASENRVIKQQIQPEGFDNNSFGVFFYNQRDIYAIRGNNLFKGDFITDLKINPSYTSLATLEHNKKGAKRVAIYDINPNHRLSDSPLKVIKSKEAQTTAMAYSADAKQLAVGASNKQITIYNPINNKEVKTFNSQIVPGKMAYSDNNYFLAIAEGKSLEIWNLERETIRKTLQLDSDIKDFTFSNSSSNLLVMTKDAKLYVYDTKTFEVISTIENLEQALACYPNESGKYVAVLNSDKRISVINILDPTERHIIENPTGGITGIRIVHHNLSDNSYIIYNTYNSITYQHLKGLTPYYNKMMTTMLNEKLNQWMKQLPGESMEDYQLRVNEASRMEQARLIEREIATQMATGLLEEAEVEIGDYNMSTNSVALKFNNMPGIFLPVPTNELNDFTDGSKLEFRHAKYALNPDDKFELVYAEVYNPVNGKTYIFDNLNRQSLGKMSEDDNFVPLEIIQKSNMEETALVGIKEDVISLAQQNNVISDKTHISVKTEAVNAVNADGEKIVNYNVDFTYEVEEEFSARDDFKSGHYHTEESAAAMLMLNIMTKAFENDFAKYIVKGKRVKIKIKGTADASPIARALRYDGRYGEFEGEPVYKNNELNNITLNQKEGIADNEQLAFARAIGVQNYIEKEISAFGDMTRDYEYHIEVAKESGSQFRRISVQYTFIDAF